MTNDVSPPLAQSPGTTLARLFADEREFMHTIARDELNARERTSYDLFEFMVSQRVTQARCKEWRTPLNSDSGFHSDVLYMDELTHPQNVADYERFIARLQDVPRFFNEHVANMRIGMRDRFTLPAAILDGVSKVIASEQYDDAQKMPLWRPFATFSPAVPESERARLAVAGNAVLVNAVMPADAAFQRFFESEYRPAARATISASALPDGEAYYADLVRYFTTLPDATPERIHEVGVAEVARLRGEMEAILRDVNHGGSFAEFVAFLRADPQFYAKTTEELLREAAWIAKEIDGKLPEYFGKLPRMPYAVKPVPDAFVDA